MSDAFRPGQTVILTREDVAGQVGVVARVHTAPNGHTIADVVISQGPHKGVKVVARADEMRPIQAAE